jgi:ceramide glucosyltransferase
MLDALAAIFATVSLGLHGWSAIAAARPRKAAPCPARDAVSVVIPLCGVEPFSRECIAAALALEHGDGLEVLFCVAHASDPVADLAAAMIDQSQGCCARLLIGNDVISANPKLNNMSKGYRAARHPWVCFVDSNVLMPRNYISRLMSAWRYGETGVVSAPPIGTKAWNLAAEIEAAFLNTYQARWQFAAGAAGQGFAQGKTLLFSRTVLEAGGGIDALGAELAEDAAATKLVRGLGLKVTLAPMGAEQPLGRRKLREVWKRQVRWARLRRATFPAEFACEIATSGLLTVAAAWFAGSPLYALGAASLWYGIELALAVENAWPVTPWTLPAMLARDALLPVLWCSAWLGGSFEWRGHKMSADA